MAPPDKTRLDRPLVYAIALLLLPALVLWRHDDPLYTPLWQSDPWFYLGYFYNLANFKRDLFPNFYYGSRLAWLLPGYLAHALLSPLIANALMHLAVHTAGVLSLFATLRRTIGLRVAYLTAMVFSLYPWYWAATGWDHVNGGAIAYYLVALAMVTRAAERPGRKWSLVVAGMAIAGAVHSHLFLLALGPFLLLHYAGFACAWHGRQAIRSLPAVCGWMAAGFVAFTLPICAINYQLVDGNFWFWSPSLRTAQTVTQNYTWTESVWYEGKLVPYLWFIAVALVAALATTIALLPAFRKEPGNAKGAAGLIFSTQLLLATALMVFLQGRGVTLLGHYYYACYLFPFAFPVLGCTLLPAVEKMADRAWTITCCGATVLFALPWVEPEANPFLSRWITQFGAFLLVGSILAAAFVLRARAAGAWLTLSGLALLALLTYNGSYRWVPIHGTRQEYVRIMDARRLIEEHRDNAPILFWYDKTEPAYFEYYGLNSSYLAEFSRISENFPQGCATKANRGTAVVVASRREHTAEVALQALTDCWRGTGVRPVVQATQDVDRPGQPFRIVIFKAVNDFGLLRPLRADFAPSGIGRLAVVENASEPVPLPLERWVASNGAEVKVVPGGLAVRTPPTRTGYAITYAPLIVPAAGRYRFELKGKALVGRIAFGAFPADESRWLGTDIFGLATKSGHDYAFNLDLKGGDTVRLRIANNNPADSPSTFVIQDVFVTAIPPAM
jgi:hypothetical protein